MSRIPEVASVPVEDNAKNFDEEYEVDGGDGDEGGKEEEEEEDEQTDLFQNVSNLIDGQMTSSAQNKRRVLAVVSSSSSSNKKPKAAVAAKKGRKGAAKGKAKTKAGEVYDDTTGAMVSM